MTGTVLRVATIFLLVLLIPRPAYAYLDPATGSMLLSAVVSTLVTTGLALQAYGHRLLGFLRRRTRRARGETDARAPEQQEQRSSGLLHAWRCYRRFQRRPREWRGIVFFAETRQDWHHFAPLIERLTGQRPVCYLTSDPDDFAFEHEGERLRCYHVPPGWARMLAFRTLRADVLVLTMMDLGNLELKRSVQPVHYVYVFHSLGSTHMVDYPNSYDHYDTILCAAPHQLREIRRREGLAELPPKELLAHGYARLEALIDSAPPPRSAKPAGEPLTVLVAPTWGEHSIFPTCGEELLRILLDAGFRVIARPHYETQRRSPELLAHLRAAFQEHPRFEYVDRMAESDSLFRSDLLISDWSAMAVEYALGLSRPVLFVDVPPRVRNPGYRELGIVPLEISIRERVGAVLPLDALDQAPALVAKLAADPPGFATRIAALRQALVFNLGSSGEVGAAEIARIADQRAGRGRGR